MATPRARSSSTSRWTSSSSCGARPRWREIAEGVLFQDGDIVEHGEAAEAGSGDGGEATTAARPPADGSLGIGSLKGAAR